MESITKEEFLAYERVRSEGKYNMIMDAKLAMQEAGLSHEKYSLIIKYYSELAEKYL